MTADQEQRESVQGNLITVSPGDFLIMSGEIKDSEQHLNSVGNLERANSVKDTINKSPLLKSIQDYIDKDKYKDLTRNSTL